jgi:hypothetical protein
VTDNLLWRGVIMSLFEDILERPAQLALTSKYLVANGLLYIGAGVLLIAWPGSVQTLFADPAFVGHEEGLFRVIGAALVVVGWLCVSGGRSGSRLMVASTVPDRVVFIPAVFVPLALAGVFPHFLIAIAILDPALGIGAWVLLARSAR